MADDEWVQEATGDDAMVAELLLHFKQLKPRKQAAGPASTASKRALSVEWTVRQRRSRAVMVQTKKQAPRASPTTPLSWSGATSVSGGGGGGSGSGGGAFDGGPEEESSRPSPPPPLPPPKRSDTTRSKVIGTSETTSNKRSRRKKTLTELKEEEDSLQKERRQLKRELATLHLKLEKARATNENLKRMKLELQVPPAAESGSIVSSELTGSDQLQQKIESIVPRKAISTPIDEGSVQRSPKNVCSEVEEEVVAGKFMVPDLNIPFEEPSSPDILRGVS